MSALVEAEREVEALLAQHAFEVRMGAGAYADHPLRHALRDAFVDRARLLDRVHELEEALGEAESDMHFEAERATRLEETVRELKTKLEERLRA